MNSLKDHIKNEILHALERTKGKYGSGLFVFEVPKENWEKFATLISEGKQDEASQLATGGHRKHD